MISEHVFAYDLIDTLPSFDFTMYDNLLDEQCELLDGTNWLVQVLVIMSV